MVVTEYTASCKCKPGFELHINNSFASCKLCAEGTFKDSVGNQKCLSCGAHTVSIVPRNNRTLCACAAAYEPGVQRRS
jgi:hypothetical protein